VTPTVGQPAGSHTCNVAAYLPQMAAQVPERPAVIVARGEAGARLRYAELTFRQLEEQSNRFANGLTGVGVARGTRVLVFVRPGLDYVGLVFALFKIGAVPIMIDPGMGMRRVLDCVRTVRPEAFIGIPLAHLMRVLQPGAFGGVRTVVTVGRRWCWGGPTLRGLAERAAPEFAVAATQPDETAAILFTSGSTGPPKGVIYAHGMFAAQVRAIRAHYGIAAGEVDLAAFPLFALFDPALGMTCVVPDLDPARPASVDPAKLVAAVRDQKATNTFGSPAIWERVSRYCVERGLTMPSLRRVLIAGAPVRPALIERMQRVLDPGADVHTPYGATEALPAASISGREVLAECRERSRRGAGICVGRPLPGMTACIVRISDDPIASWSDDWLLPTGDIGEIVVRGPVVTREYFGLAPATALAKIPDGGSAFWHRMGDVGYVDERGRLWFCGRKAHRVTTARGVLFTIPCEAIFNEHPDVARSALVGVGLPGALEPVLIVEPHRGKFPTGRRVAAFAEELLRLGRSSELTHAIQCVRFHRGFPVDVRHNAKIDREALARWAAERRP
jgi:olefin beta-lactone synthetase